MHTSTTGPPWRPGSAPRASPRRAWPGSSTRSPRGWPSASRWTPVPGPGSARSDRPRRGRRARAWSKNAVTLDPGDLIRPEDLALSRDHLSETRVFRSVDIRAEATDDAGVRDLVVDLAKRPDLERGVQGPVRDGPQPRGHRGPQTEESRGFQFGAGIEAANPFGRAHRYSVYGLAGSGASSSAPPSRPRPSSAAAGGRRCSCSTTTRRTIETTSITRAHPQRRLSADEAVEERPHRAALARPPAPAVGLRLSPHRLRRPGHRGDARRLPGRAVGAH